MNKLINLSQMRALARSSQDMTIREVGQLASTVAGALDEITLPASVLTIPATGWRSQGELMYRDVPMEGIDAETYVILVPAEESILPLLECEFSSSCKALDGAIRVMAGKAPKEAVNVHVLRFHSEDKLKGGSV